MVTRDARVASVSPSVRPLMTLFPSRIGILVDTSHQILDQLITVIRGPLISRNSIIFFELYFGLILMVIPSFSNDIWLYFGSIELFDCSGLLRYCDVQKVPLLLFYCPLRLALLLDVD